jgi:hypothetical protein
MSFTHQPTYLRVGACLPLLLDRGGAGVRFPRKLIPRTATMNRVAADVRRFTTFHVADAQARFMMRIRPVHLDSPRTCNCNSRRPSVLQPSPTLKCGEEKGLHPRPRCGHDCLPLLLVRGRRLATFHVGQGEESVHAPGRFESRRGFSLRKAAPETQQPAHGYSA